MKLLIVGQGIIGFLRSGCISAAKDESIGLRLLQQLLDRFKALRDRILARAASYDGATYQA